MWHLKWATIRYKVSRLLAMIVMTHLFLLLLKSSLGSSFSKVALSPLLVEHSPHFLDKHGEVFITIFRQFFFFNGGGSSLEYYGFLLGRFSLSTNLHSISWVLRFPKNLEKSISSRSLSILRVVALTSQALGRAHITFLTFWSLSITSPREDNPLVILVKRENISSIILILRAKQVNFRSLELRRSLMSNN